MASPDNSNRRRRNLTRTISFQNDESDGSSPLPKHRTASPSLLSRIRSFREDRSTIKRKKTGEESSSPTPLDDIIFLESFEESHYNEELSISVCKDMIRQNLLDLMKSCGNVQILHDMESGKVNEYNIEDLFRNVTKAEKNVAYLWAAFLKKKNLLGYFLRSGVDVNYSEPQQGFGALHLSGFNGCINCCEYLLKNGANVNLKNINYAPLHCAAFGNSPECAKALLKAGAERADNLILTAVRANAIECLKFLINNNFDVNYSSSECGLTALHIAADLGYVNCLKVLLESKKCDPDVQTRERHDTALHLAAESGFVDCVRILLQNGADANSKNYRQQTPLHLAAKTCIECVELLLKSGADPNSHDADNRTPLHSAVCKSEFEFGLEILQCLISWKANVNEKDKYGYTALHIAGLNELGDCVECLILNGGDVSARTRGGTSGLSIISRKTPSALAALALKLDDCISMNDPDASSKDVILKFNFRYLLQGCENGEIGFLQTFVEDGQKNLLENPVCEAFLYLKWQKIRKYYIARLIFCLIYVLLLSVYVLTALAYQCYNDRIREPASEIIEQRFLFNKIIVNSTLCSNETYVGILLRENPIIMELEYFFLLILTIFEILRKIYGFSGYKSFRHYITQLDNLVEWFVVISVFLISFMYTGETYIWQNHVGALAVLCAWANLMIMIGHLPIFGSYVSMYTKVQKEFAKLLLAYLCLLIGFTVGFCVIFPTTDQFTNPLIALIKILVMMTGELEFDDLLKTITKEGNKSLILLEISALTIFVFFLLFVTIILMNLLIGIAVHDIQGLKKTAGLSKLVGQTVLISQIESALFNGYLPGCLLKLLQVTALISPLAYRVVVAVKPLNPRECRLPKDVMRKALDIARQRRCKNQNTLSVKNSMRRAVKRKNFEDFNDVQLLLIKLTQEIEELKEIVKNNQKL